MRVIIYLVVFAVVIMSSADRAISQEIWKELNIHGFAEFAAAYKLKSDTVKHEYYNMLEQRIQLKSSYYPEGGLLYDLGTEFNFRGDFTVDEYYSGKTDFDIREASIFMMLGDNADIKIGRQVFTWGTGDYLFINDMFPKDYISFFIGRHDEYLKKPSDGGKLSLYNNYANLDIVATNFFTPNNLPKGDRLSFFDSFQGGISGRDSDRHLIEPPDQLDNTELAFRLYRSISSYEAALYFFRGFYKSPRGYKDELNRQLFYPRVDLYGGSLRGPFFSGIGSIEAGFYNSREDSDGNNRLIGNSSFKIMAGYEKDMGNDLRVGLQYLHETTLDYDDYKNALIPGDFFWDETRQLVTMRITQLLANQTITLSMFTFYSPTDNDIYIRPSFKYDINDATNMTVGSNLVWGENDHTELGSMERNSNIYMRFRYSF